MSAFSRIVAKNSFFSLLGQVGIKALSFVFSVFVVRRLGGESYGQYMTVLAYVNIFAIFSDLGLAPYALREIAKDKSKTFNLFSNVVALRLLLSIPAVALATGSAWFSGRDPALVWGIFVYSCGLFIYAVQGPLDALLIAKERLDYSSLFSVINQLVFVMLGTLVLVQGYGVLGLIGASLMAVLVPTVLSAGTIRRRLGGLQVQVTPRDWGYLLKRALPFGVIGFTLGLSYKVDTVLLQYFWGDAETGWYNIAYNLIFMLTTISHAVNVSLYPSMVRQHATAPDQMGQIYSRALKYLFALSVPVAVGTTVLADQIIVFLYTPAASPAILPLRILIWVLPLMFLTELLGNIVVIHNQERRVARAIGISTGVNVVLNLILIPSLGLRAAAVVTVITEAVLVVQYLWLLRRELRAVDRLNTFVKPVLSAALMGLCAWLLRGWPLLVVVALAGGLYLAGLVVLKAVDQKEVLFVRQLLTRRTPAAAEEGISQ